ncbi:MAG: phytanoyl-CoA dioxygenase family protein [Proteobacteria bacterium]|nr:phytanoyl-CoA dioxygenase family protein [Pseudomonadota bacterium]MDA0956754.1 phytanoyl-CoA dioxygenase family protein [Pseudomonadota bacterium]
MNEDSRATSRSKPDFEATKAYLEAHSGIQGLKVLPPEAVDEAVTQFHRDGFVVIGQALDAEQLEILKLGVEQAVAEIVALDPKGKGNRGPGRYSFGGSSLSRSQLHRPAWQMLLSVEPMQRMLDAMFGCQDYRLRAASGDFCMPMTMDYQRLHSDVRDWVDAETTPFSAFHDPSGRLSLRDLPCPYICVNFLPQDIHALNGPTRQIPGSQKSRAPIPRLEQEPEWMRLSTVTPVPAGSMMIRDVRAWHGGTPNLSNEVRAIPNLEFYAPWFREPIVPGISIDDFKKLPPRAQQLAELCVPASGETFITGPTLKAP